MKHPMQSLNGHLRKQYGVDLYGVKNSDNLSDSFKVIFVIYVTRLNDT